MKQIPRHWTRPFGVILVGVLGLIPTSNAAPAYVRDTLYVPLRATPDYESDFVRKALVSGTQVETLSDRAENGYRWVRFQEANGNTVDGYIEAQYLVSEPIAKDQLQGVKTALEAAEQSNNLLTIELKTALDAKVQANAAATSSRAAMMETQANLERLQALSRDAQITAEQLTNTKEKNRQLAADLAKLQAAQSQQHDDVHKRWFLTGSGVVFISLLIGFWVSRRIYHRSLSGGWS